MSKNVINLTLRFILELVALFAIGYWGWTQHEGILRLILAVGIPLIAAVVWGTFRVPNDPGVPPIQVSGLLRLLLEILFFGLAVGLLFAAQQPAPALIFGGIVLFHYLISYDRVIWLLSQ